MRTNDGRERKTEPTASAGPSLAFWATMLASGVFLLLGAQLAFLARLPHLSALVRDKQAMWLVFSTWPQMSFVLFFCFLVAIHQIVSGLAWQGFASVSALHRLRSMGRPAIVVATGISVFLLPLVLAMPAVFLDLAVLLFCALIGCLFFIRASRTGTPWPILWTIGALSLGFFGNLLMTTADHNGFACTAGAVQLLSGESLPCSNLVWLSGKPLWLVEGPQPPRLVLRTDIDFD